MLFCRRRPHGLAQVVGETTGERPFRSKILWSSDRPYTTSPTCGIFRAFDASAACPHLPTSYSRVGVPISLLPGEQPIFCLRLMATPSFFAIKPHCTRQTLNWTAVGVSLT